MSGDTFQHYSLEIWLKWQSEPLLIPVAEAAWGRFRRAREEKRQGFFICATTNGLTLAINLQYIQLAKLIQETWSIEAVVKGRRHNNVNLWLYGRTLESFQAADPADLANIFTVLKPNVENEVLSFTDIDGDVITLFTEDLVVLETSTIFLEEGFSQLYTARTGRKPPSIHRTQTN